MREAVALEGNRVFKVPLLCPNKVNITFYITFFANNSKMIHLIGSRKKERERTGVREREKKKRENGSVCV